MPLILAIEPDRRQATQLSEVVFPLLRTDGVIASSAERGLAKLGDRVPDLILTSALLAPQDEMALAERLRALAGAASYVQTLTIPVLAAPPAKKSRGVLSKLRRQNGHANPEGCDPHVFAEQCAEYLERARAERELVESSAPGRAIAAPSIPLVEEPVVQAIPEPVAIEFPAVEIPAEFPAVETYAVDPFAADAPPVDMRVDEVPSADFYIPIPDAPVREVAALEMSVSHVSAVERAQPVDELVAVSRPVHEVPAVAEAVNEMVTMAPSPVEELPAFASTVSELSAVDTPVAELFAVTSPVFDMTVIENPVDEMVPLRSAWLEELSAFERPVNELFDVEKPLEDLFAIATPVLEMLPSEEAAETRAFAAFFDETPEVVIPLDGPSAITNVRDESFILAKDLEEFSAAQSPVAEGFAEGELDEWFVLDESVLEPVNPGPVMLEAASYEAPALDTSATIEDELDDPEALEDLWAPLEAAQVWPALEGEPAESRAVVVAIEQPEFLEPAAMVTLPDTQIIQPTASHVAGGARSDAAATAGVIESVSVAVAVAPDVRPDAHDPHRPIAKRQSKQRAIQDEWGLFDPEQCGFAALLKKLDEITNVA